LHHLKPGERRGRSVALTREPSATLAECELSFVDREPIDVPRARVEHAGYCAALRAADSSGKLVEVTPSYCERMAAFDLLVGCGLGTTDKARDKEIVIEIRDMLERGLRADLGLTLGETRVRCQQRAVVPVRR